VKEFKSNCWVLSVLVNSFSITRVINVYDHRGNSDYEWLQLEGRNSSFL